MKQDEIMPQAPMPSNPARKRRWRMQTIWAMNWLGRSSTACIPQD